MNDIKKGDKVVLLDSHVAEVSNLKLGRIYEVTEADESSIFIGLSRFNRHSDFILNFLHGVQMLRKATTEELELFTKYGDNIANTLQDL